MVELDLKELDFQETWELLERVRIGVELTDPEVIESLVGWAPTAKVDDVMKLWSKIESAEEKAIAYDEIAAHLNEVFILGRLKSWNPTPESLPEDFGGLSKENKQAIAAVARVTKRVMNTEMPEALQEEFRKGEYPEFKVARDKYGSLQIVTEDMASVDNKEWEEPNWFDVAPSEDDEFKEFVELVNLPISPDGPE
jgi:hypothetical protein